MDGPGMTGQAQREKRASETVRQTRDMVAMINPLLGAAEFVFCATNDAGLAAKAQASSLGWFNEGEGTSLILERSVAEALDSASPHEPRSVDSPKSAFVSLAAVANRAKPLQRTMPSWRIEVQCGGGGRLAHGPLANVKAPVGPTGAAQQLFQFARSSPNLCACPSLTRSNRRGTDPYARWCGRGGAARHPPIPIRTPFVNVLPSRAAMDSIVWRESDVISASHRWASRNPSIIRARIGVTAIFFANGFAFGAWAPWSRRCSACPTRCFRWCCSPRAPAQSRPCQWPGSVAPIHVSPPSEETTTSEIP